MHEGMEEDVGVSRAICSRGVVAVVCAVRHIRPVAPPGVTAGQALDVRTMSVVRTVICLTRILCRTY